MKYLSPQDAAFVRMESVNTPMHVGSLLTFRLPENAPPDYLAVLLRQMREQPMMPAPFNCRLSQARRAKIAPAWEECEMDIDYHIRHSALPYPGGERELGVLVARLHSHPMDLTRPLWEAHVIEGLENRRFALYFKAHHCAIDGMGAMLMVRNWLTEDPTDMSGPGPGVLPPRRRAPAEPSSFSKRYFGLLRNSLNAARGNVKSVQELVKTFYQFSKGGEESVLRAAGATPRTLFNVPVTQQRRLGTQLLDLKRFKAITDATGTTINDVCLTLCSSAARRYLLERNALPEASLTASVPIGLPRADDKPGNAVTGFVCPLGTNEANPAKRLKMIHAVTSRTKEQMLKMSPTALEQFALIGMAPLILGQMTGQLSRLPPFFNFVVSNVVLSKKPLYLKGAMMEAMYPISFLFDGYAINCTIIGYNGRVAVGFVGCRNAVPSLQRLAVYTGDALTELEKELGIGTGAAPVTKAAPRATKAAKTGAKKTARKTPAVRKIKQAPKKKA